MEVDRHVCELSNGASSSTVIFWMSVTQLKWTSRNWIVRHQCPIGDRYEGKNCQRYYFGVLITASNGLGSIR